MIGTGPVLVTGTRPRKVAVISSLREFTHNGAVNSEKMSLRGSRSHRCRWSTCRAMVCDAVLMIASLVYRAVRGLLSLPELLFRREASVEAEVLVLRLPLPNTSSMQVG